MNLKENFLLRGFKNEIFLSYSNEIKKFDFILIFILNFIFLLKVVL